MLIEILYTISATIAIGACIPQVMQLWRSKSSEEFSLQTWATWMVTQAVTLIYVASIGNVLLVGVNVIWVSFYACMVVLIVRYRHKDMVVGQKSMIAAQLRD